MKLVRLIVGKLILLADKITTPKSIKRSVEKQQSVDNKTSQLTIYEFLACPFCVKARREIKRLNLNIERRNVKENSTHKHTLISKGGKYQVPCLRIDSAHSTQWMYESDDIIQYLRNHFS